MAFYAIHALETIEAEAGAISNGGETDQSLPC